MSEFPISPDPRELSKRQRPQSEANNLAFQFSGNGYEYFKIWIVNITLTILTFGIYSAWAKVRRKRYFYRNTSLHGSAFEYTADPIAILKGRLIAFAVFATYAGIVNLYPLAKPFLWLIFIPMLPWVVIRSLKFNALNSAYRNIHFNFTAPYQEALIVYVLIPVTLIFTLGFSYPWFDYRRRKLIIENHRYGQSVFQMNAPLSAFYKLYGFALLIFIVGSIFTFFLYFTMPPLIKGNESWIELRGTLFDHASVWLMPGFGFLIYLSLVAFLLARLQNLVWNSSSLEKIRFESQLTDSGMFWLYLSNSLAIMVTMGLFIPWAQVRMVRYRIERLKAISNESIDRFLASEQQKSSATGDEVSEIFDLDISI